MPTYEFRCPDGHDFEKFYRSIGGAESVATCPTCGKTAERVMSAAGFAFKGSGFYLTDYGKNAHRGDASPGAKAGESGDAAATSASSDGKAESKSDAKGEASSASKSESGSAAGASASSDVKKSEPKPAPAKAADKPAKKSSSE